MIHELREFIMNNIPIIPFFNKLGGVEYAIYKRNDVIIGTKYIDHFVTHNGNKYKVDGYSNYIINSDILEYNFDDLTSDDIVLELGATIGDQTITMAKKAKHVYAVEPIYVEELKANIILNNMNNITVIPLAIGDGKTLINISHNKNVKEGVKSHCVSSIIESIPETITFLKCDIDGYEWYIKPDDLKTIRRIEMEVHPFYYPYETYNPELMPYIRKNYKIDVTQHLNRIYVIHALRSDLNDK